MNTCPLPGRRVSDQRALEHATASSNWPATTDSAVEYGQGMAKAARILAALQRDGWSEARRSGSHRVLVKGDQQRIWAYHDGVDLGGPALARIARDYGYTVDELRKL
jgi:predicted RNA binding protein YcfA (HicA-like mRNA interferase family)